MRLIRQKTLDRLFENVRAKERIVLRQQFQGELQILAVAREKEIHALGIAAEKNVQQATSNETERCYRIIDELRANVKDQKGPSANTLRVAADTIRGISTGQLNG